MAEVKENATSSPYVPITIQFKASNLADKDTFSKSDPMLVVYSLSPKQPGFGFKPAKGNFNAMELFRTERVSNNLNPVWAKTMTFVYKFEEEQWLFLQVLDVDQRHSLDSSSQDFLGGLITTVGRMATVKADDWFTGVLLDKNERQISVHNASSTISAKITVMPKVNTSYNLTCKFTLASTKTFGSDTPFFSLINQNGQVVHESHKGHGKVTLYNKFNLQGMHATKTTWKFAHNHKPDGLIGYATISEQQLNVLQDNASIPVLDDKGKVKGDLTFMSIERIKTEEEVKDSIVNHLMNGLNISAVVAIDFTGSNGNPAHPKSLHYQAGANQYRNAINAIIPIIDQYDTDHKYPVYGFGMEYDNKVYHSKLLAADASYSDGVVMAYSSAFDGNMKLSGPTCFAPIITKVTNELENNGNSYTILVIFTDGVVTDLNETIDAIVEASYKPMSLIIVGIGTADFTSMNMLDNDGQPPLTTKAGKKAKRDIVEFVPIRDCPDANTLRAKTLAEVPNHIKEYFNSK